MEWNFVKGLFGLTADPLVQKTERGDFADCVIWPSSSEVDVRTQEEAKAAESYRVGIGDEGWCYGCMYTVVSAASGIKK